MSGASNLMGSRGLDVPEIILGHLNDDGTVSGGIDIPGLASLLADPATGPALSSRAWTRFRPTNVPPRPR